MISTLNERNPELTIRSVFDPSFLPYGFVLNPIPYETYFDYLEKHTIVPAIKNQYVAHDQELETFIGSSLRLPGLVPHQTYQFGYVNGHNTKLNALEYHKSSEINVVLTPLVLFLGHTSKIKNNSFHTTDLEIFFVPAKTVIEIFDTTLHFSPCKVQESGFKCGVILPYGTNMQFETVEHKQTEEDYRYFKTNKWLLAHPENTTLVDIGAHIGIIGPNLEINY